MSILKPFNDLLSNLQEKGIISEEESAKYRADFESKVNESAEGDKNLEMRFNEALTSSVKKICDEFNLKLAEADDVANTGSESEAKMISVQEVFQEFIESLAEENVEAFNQLSETLSDEQKELMKKFLSGEFDKGEEETVEAPQIDQPNPEVPANVPAPSENDELLQESAQLLAALSNVVSESGNKELLESLISEASPNLIALTKKYEREREKFLKASIKNLNRKNQEMLLSGGVAGGLRRIRNADVSLQQLRRKLYLSESHVQDLSDKVFTLNEQVLALEAESRSLNEHAISEHSEAEGLRSKLSKVEAEKNSLNESVKKLEKTKTLLTEQVATAKSEASINEAQAYLVESTATLGPDLKNHLLMTFRGKGIEEVRSGLNEAVEAYHEAKRSVVKNLRKSKPGQISRTISEAVQDGDKADAVDPFVAQMTAIGESAVRMM